MSEELGDSLEFEPASYDEGSAELAQAHLQLGNAAGDSAAVQGQAGDAMLGWPPTAAAGEALDNIHAAADQALSLTEQVTAEDSAKLLASKQTMTDTEARLSDQIGQIRATEATEATGSADPSLDERAIAERIEELKTEGPDSHGPQHHLEVSDAQLKRRLGRPVLDSRGRPRLKGNGFVRSVGHIDPETGTTTDAISGLPHRSGSMASRFDSAADFVHADSVLRARADDTGAGLQTMPIAELLGPDAHTRMTGFYIDPANPRLYHPVNFEDGSVVAVYSFDRDGKPFLITMYPEAARWRHP
jgi:hypothetical protein